MKINLIGLWIMRIMLVVGAIILAYRDKDDMASMLIFGLVCSFLFVDAD